MQTHIAIALAVFFAVLFALAFWASRRIESEVDFIVAGRRMPGWVSFSTLLATWFGAGSLLISADAVYAEGVIVTALEPFGVTTCLLLAAMFLVKRLRREEVLTVADIIGSRFGRTAEVLLAVYSFSYIGWIAAQLIGLGGMVHLFLGIDMTSAIVVVAVVLTLYTLMGGMWSVAITDVFQLVLLAVGLIYLSASVFSVLGQGSVVNGVTELFARTDPAALDWFPTDNVDQFVYWLGLYIVGALGSLSAQDLAQRIFGAKSTAVAQRACTAAALVYIPLAILPVLLGLAARLLLDENASSVIPALASQFLSPTVAVIFILTIAAAVTSTIDSAMLAPASTLAQNLLRPMLGGRIPTLLLVRMCVVVISLASVAAALSGTRALDLLQGSYALGIPPLVVVMGALYQRTFYAAAAIVTLVAGLLLWASDTILQLASVELPSNSGSYITIAMLFGSAGVYALTHAFCAASARKVTHA